MFLWAARNPLCDNDIVGYDLTKKYGGSMQNLRHRIPMIHKTCRFDISPMSGNNITQNPKEINKEPCLSEEQQYWKPNAKIDPT